MENVIITGILIVMLVVGVRSSIKHFKGEGGCCGGGGSIMGKTKVFVTRALDKLEKMDIVERVERRKTVLTAYGNQLAAMYQKKLKAAERYMQFQDLAPALARENAMAMLSAGFTDEFLRRMEE